MGWYRVNNRSVFLVLRWQSVLRRSACRVGVVLTAAATLGMTAGATHAATDKRAPSWRITEICADDSARGQCRLYEAVARQRLVSGWTLIPPTWREQCLSSFSAPNAPSWRMLFDCINAQARASQDARRAAIDAQSRADMAQMIAARRAAENARRRAIADAAAAAEKAEREVAARRAAENARRRALADAAAAADKTEREAAARRATKQAALRKQIAAAQAAERAANEEASRVEAARLAAAERKVEAERRDAQRREAARIEAARRDEERMAAERRQHAEAQRLAAAAEQARVRAEKKRREAQRASQAEEAERRAAELARLQAAAVEADRIATEKARLAEAQARLTAFEADCRARILAIIEPRPIRFSFARADVRAAARAQLREIASVAQSCPTVRFRVDGHTDANGDSFTNMWLSKERARSVVSLLARFGVEAQRITSAGFGEDRPISSNATRIGRQENRRIDFTVLTGRTAAVPSDVPKTVARRTD